MTTALTRAERKPKTMLSLPATDFLHRTGLLPGNTCWNNDNRRRSCGTEAQSTAHVHMTQLLQRTLFVVHRGRPSGGGTSRVRQRVIVVSKTPNSK